MRLIFAGTPEFVRVALAALHAAGHTIALVLTQPDRPAGRGMQLQASSVKQLAQDFAVPVCQPRSLRLDGKYPQDAAAAREAILGAAADAMVVAAYGIILPQWVLDAMQQHPHQHGCLNIHASLLPRWRGAAPIHRAIEAGDPQTGVTIMQMDAGLDTGAMLLRKALPVEDDDTTATLHDKLAALGARMMVDVLAHLGNGPMAGTAQPQEGVTYAAKVDKHEAAIDWSHNAAAVARRVRAFNPSPGAFAQLGGDTVKVWNARELHLPAATATAVPGTIIGVTPQGIDVAAGRGWVRLTELQRAGGKRLRAAEFLRGVAVQPGMVFASGHGV